MLGTKDEGIRDQGSGTETQRRKDAKDDAKGIRGLGLEREMASRTLEVQLSPENGEMRSGIRTARMDDALAIAGLMTQLGYPATKAQIEVRLGVMLPRDDYLTLVAEVDGRVVGVVSNFVGYTPESDGLYGHILAMVVDEGYRSRGIGAALVAESERWFREQGARFVTVTSNKRRVDAHRFYERLGYDAGGLRFSKRMDVE